MTLVFYKQIFRKILKYKLSWKTVQREASCSIRTDRRADITKLIVAVRNFANKPKNYEAFLSDSPFQCLLLYMLSYICSTGGKKQWWHNRYAVLSVGRATLEVTVRVFRRSVETAGPGLSPPIFGKGFHKQAPPLECTPPQNCHTSLKLGRINLSFVSYNQASKSQRSNANYQFFHWNQTSKICDTTTINLILIHSVHFTSALQVLQYINVTILHRKFRQGCFPSIQFQLFIHHLAHSLKNLVYNN
jgi:hypothetical protein